MFFYYQIYGSIALMILSMVSSVEKYTPSYWDNWGSYLAFLLAFLPRLGGFILVGFVATVLLRRRDWFWVRNLRFTLYAGMVFTLLSLIVDILFFPTAAVTNALRLAMLGVWLGYFYVSERVNRVFLHKSWS